MKTWYLPMIIGICIITIAGVLVTFGNFFPSTSSAYLSLHKTPSLPKIIILLNGTNSAQQPFLQFNVSHGQNMILLLNVTSDPQNLPITLSVGPKLGFESPEGVDWNLSSHVINNTSTSVLLDISTGNNVKPGKYPMEVDANTAQLPNENFTESFGFDLVVTK